MRLYVSVDLEGIHGVDRFDNHDERSAQYREWKRRVSQLMRDEIMALYRGFQQRGDLELTVFDSHGSSSTLQIEGGHPRLTQERRHQDNNVHFPGLDGTFSGIVFWGYHVKAGSPDGRLAHTASRRIKEVRINQRRVGEVYAHAYYASFVPVPLVAASGDSGLHTEIREDLADIPFFDSGIGDHLARDEYLGRISEFAARLDLDHAIALAGRTRWPESSRLTVTYHRPLVNLARWVVRGQFRYARLIGLDSCCYARGSFVDQWDQFSGFARALSRASTSP